MFRIAGSARIFSLAGEAVPAVEVYLRKRDVPWSIGGNSVNRWLTRAEILDVDKNFMQVQDGFYDDGHYLCQFIKGKRATGSLNEDDRAFRTNTKGYVDLPKKGVSLNPYFYFAGGPFPWFNTSIQTTKKARDAMQIWIARINNEALFPPDDNCSLSDLHNDKKNFRGILYLSYLIWRDEPLYIPGFSSPIILEKYLKEKKITKDSIINLFYQKNRIYYTKLSRLTNDILSFSGAPLY